MKRLTALLLALVMLLGLTACGGKDSKDNGGGNTASQPSGDAGKTEAQDPASGDLTEWEQSSGIYNTNETDEELYQKEIGRAHV